MFFHNDKKMHESLIRSLSTSTANTPVSPFLSSFSKYVVFPGFVDVHVHLREPGYFYKERMETGTMAAAAGGYTRVMSMPNLSPVPDSLENLKGFNIPDAPSFPGENNTGINNPNIERPAFNPPVPNRAWTAMRMGVDIDELDEEEKRDLYLGRDNQI